MDSIKFEKYQGCGNDFIIIDQRNTPNHPNTELIRLMADRHFGIGCDQLFYIYAKEGYDAGFYIYNRDGSTAQSCGNGTRAVVDYLANKGGLGQKKQRLWGPNGLLECQIHPNQTIEVNMGVAHFSPELIPMNGALDTQGRVPLDIENFPRPTAVQIGNPHTVFIMDKEISDNDLVRIGALVERHPLFPERTNVEFVSPIADNHYRMRVFERGVGVTLACGSGGCAVFAVLNRYNLVGKECRLSLDGGDLWFHYNAQGQIIMRGPVVHSFSGLFHANPKNVLIP